MGLKPRGIGNLVDGFLTAIRKVYDQEGAELVAHRGASDEAIDAYKRAVAQSPSSTLLALWKAADGIDSTLLCRPGFFTGYELLSLQGSLRCRAAMEQRAPRYGDYQGPESRLPRDQRIRADWYHVGWLPFASFGGSTLLLIEDHSPSKEGRLGQIIGFVHDPDEMVYVAESLPELLELSVAHIRSEPDEYGIE